MPTVTGQGQTPGGKEAWLQLNALRETTDRLADTVDDLQKRLEPLIPPKVQDTRKEPERPMALLSSAPFCRELEQQIRIIMARAEQLTAIVRDLEI